MTTALALRNFVGGAWTSTRDGLTLPLVEPGTGREFGTAALSRWSDVDEVMDTAASAARSWARTTPRQRQRALLHLADALEEHAAEFTAAECRDTGKPTGLVERDELPWAVDLLRFYGAAARLQEDTAAAEYRPGHTSFVRREPIGVCAQVTSWTHPLVLAVAKIAPALAAGNTVVIKPAETTPVSTSMLVETAARYLPAGVLNLICGDRDSGRAMVAHEAPGMFSITGTVRSGMEVAAAAAADLKRAHLQLGSKAAAVVFDDADVRRAARCIAAAAFGNAGQSCTAPSRVLVAAGVHDELVQALAGWARQMRPGPPGDSEAAFGPLNSAGQLELVREFLDRLPQRARVVAGGRRWGGEGFFHEATVIEGMRHDDELVRNEVLGPLITVQCFDDEQQAVDLANGVRYGLVASVWTQQHARAMRMSRRVQAGTVWINAHHPMAAEMPHSGFKHSASGRDLGRAGLEEYSRVKHVMSFTDE